MLPLRATSSICLSEPNFFALMGTAVVITAAATFWCTRRRLNTKLNPTCCTPAAVSSPVTQISTTPTNSIVIDDTCSYLCSNCGTENYSPEESKAIAASTSNSKSSPYKMVILVRSDLNMGKGKAAAQCCHAVLAAYKSATSHNQTSSLKKWEREGQPKVTLKIETETEMVELMQKARLAGLVAESIRDAGRTQVAAGTRTVCAIGPAPAKLIDTITGHLKLY